MKDEKKIHALLLKDMQDKTAFSKAQAYGYEYLDKAFERNVYPTAEAIANLKHFEEAFPQSPTEATAVVDLLNTYGSPATSTIVGGRYFGFVNGGVVPAGLAAKNLSIYWDQNAAMQVISPIASKLEVVVEGWLRQIFNMPERTAAGFVSGTSAANFCGLAAARYRALKRQNWDISEKGLFNAPKIRVVVSRDTHSTVMKALGLLGFGKEHLEWVDVDDQGRMIPDRIPKLDERTILILQAGNVNSGSFDPFNEICEKARAANTWVHVDGAFGLWAAAVESLRHLTNGVERANSWAVDGHKTLNTPYDSGIVLCDDRDALVSALHMSGSYIIHGSERDGMFYTPEMSRRARIVELWATLKSLGRRGIDEMAYGFHERAVQFAKEIRAFSGFTVLNDVVFNQVLVRCETDELTTKTIARIQELRECWVGGATWQGRKVIRVSICSWATTPADITRSVKSFERALQEVKQQESVPHK